MNKKLLFWLSLATLISALLVFIFTRTEEVASENTLPTVSNTTPEAEEPDVKTDSSVAQEKRSEPPTSYYECKNYQKEFDRHTRKWETELQNNAAQWIDKGYSADQITDAIAYFRHDNFAASWRTNHLKKDSEGVKANLEARRQLQAKMGKKLPGILQLELRYPKAELENIAKLSAQERQTLLDESTVSVDDLAAFILDKNTAEPMLIELARTVPDYQSVIGSLDEFAPLYLLELAVSEGRFQLAEFLLNNGAEPAQDYYLPNALEIAMDKLSRYSNSQHHSASLYIEKLLPIINELIKKDLSIRTKVSQQGDLRLTAPRMYYGFTSDQIEQLKLDFGLNIYDIPSVTRETSSQTAQQLIEQINELKKQKLNSIYVNFDSETASQDCNQLVNNANAQWQLTSNKSDELFAQLEVEFPNNFEAISHILQSKDPDLSRCYSQRHAYKVQRDWEDLKLAQEFSASSSAIASDAYFNFLQERQPSQEEKNWAFYSVLNLSKFAQLYKLMDMGVIPDQIDYFLVKPSDINLQVIETLTDKGFDLRTSDRYGRTLVYIAAQYFDAKSVEFLYENDFPFSQENGVEDPLHLALSAWKQNFSSDKLAQILPILMKFSPEIDSYHLARMKLIQLRDPDFYQEIVNDYPQLSIKPNTELPQGACIW